MSSLQANPHMASHGFSDSYYEIFMGMKFYEAFEKSFQYERNNSKMGKKTTLDLFKDFSKLLFLINILRVMREDIL